MKRRVRPPAKAARMLAIARFLAAVAVDEYLRETETTAKPAKRRRAA